MTERNYNPFTGRGEFPEPQDTPYKGLKRFLTEDFVGLKRVQVDQGTAPILIEEEVSE
jgi:hypothetical protein